MQLYARLETRCVALGIQYRPARLAGRLGTGATLPGLPLQKPLQVADS
jgi:hypothetical protein